MHVAPDKQPACFQIGDLVLDTGSRRVIRGGEALPMGGLTFDLLQALAEASPSMVTYDALAERVWEGRPVAPETIAQRAKMLRAALGDDARSPRYLELVRGQGYRLAVDAKVLDELPARQTPRRPPIWLAAAVVALVVLVVIGLLKEERMPSVAVLPFADMSRAGDQRYLADGIAEELINQLAQLDGLDVVSRTESFYFRDEGGDPKNIGEQLNVAAILEGSVRRSEDDIRVTVQLIDTASNYHLWSQTFDRELKDLFAIQEEIALAVAGALGVQLGVGAVNEFFGAGTSNIDAYEAFLRGDFAKAIELDPEYAAAWGEEGIRVAGTMWVNAPEAAPAIVERAYAYVEKATRLDPRSSQAQTNLGTLSHAIADWGQSEVAFERALGLRRDSYTLLHYANMLMRNGYSRRAREIRDEHDALLRLPNQQSNLRVNIDIALGQLDEAKDRAARQRETPVRFLPLKIALNGDSISDIRAAIDALPRNDAAFRHLHGPVGDVLDRSDEALSLLKNLAKDPRRTWPSKYTDISLYAAFLGDPVFAFELLSKELRLTRVRYGVMWYPVMTGVRKLPAFKTFLTDQGLVDYFREYGWPDYCRPRGEEDFVCE